MKRIAIVLTLALAIVPSAFAGEIITDSVWSKVLGETVSFNVYLPDGYDSSVGRPVIYLLHGLSDDQTAWMKMGSMNVVADELIASGECVPALIVMPCAGGLDTANMWNGYFNMPGRSYETFFFEELIPAVEAKYNAGGDRSLRAVMGLSMGGGGSVVYSQRHPDMFSSCYAMSPWLDNEKGEVGGTITEKNKLYYVCEAVKEHSAIEFVKDADEDTVAALKTVRWFIDCGDDDYLFDQSIALYQQMRDRGIKCELRVRNGKHSWEYWHQSLRMALPFASRNFTFQ